MSDSEPSSSDSDMLYSTCNADNKCRICLTESGEQDVCEPWPNSWKGMESTIAYDIYKLTKIMIYKNNRNKFICTDCCATLQHVCKFVNTIRLSDLIMKNSYRNRILKKKKLKNQEHANTQILEDSSEDDYMQHERLEINGSSVDGDGDDDESDEFEDDLIKAYSEISKKDNIHLDKEGDVEKQPETNMCTQEHEKQPEQNMCTQEQEQEVRQMKQKEGEEEKQKQLNKRNIVLEMQPERNICMQDQQAERNMCTQEQQPKQNMCTPDQRPEQNIPTTTKQHQQPEENNMCIQQHPDKNMCTKNQEPEQNSTQVHQLEEIQIKQEKEELPSQDQSENKKAWPQPIQLVKSVPNVVFDSTIEVKQEVMSEDEYSMPFGESEHLVAVKSEPSDYLEGNIRIVNCNADKKDETADEEDADKTSHSFLNEEYPVSDFSTNNTSDEYIPEEDEDPQSDSDEVSRSFSDVLLHDQHSGIMWHTNTQPEPDKEHSYVMLHTSSQPKPDQKLSCVVSHTNSQAEPDEKHSSVIPHTSTQPKPDQKHSCVVSHTNTQPEPDKEHSYIIPYTSTQSEPDPQHSCVMSHTKTHPEPDKKHSYVTPYTSTQPEPTQQHSYAVWDTNTQPEPYQQHSYVMPHTSTQPKSYRQHLYVMPHTSAQPDSYLHHSYVMPHTSTQQEPDTQNSYVMLQTTTQSVPSLQHSYVMPHTSTQQEPETQNSYVMPQTSTQPEPYLQHSYFMPYTSTQQESDTHHSYCMPHTNAQPESDQPQEVQQSHGSVPFSSPEKISDREDFLREVGLERVIKMEPMSPADYLDEEYLDWPIKKEPWSEEEETDLSLDCQLCAKELNCLSGLRAHVIAQHSYKSVSVKNSASKQKPTKFTCHICGKSFRTKTEQMVHSARHAARAAPCPHTHTRQQYPRLLDLVKKESKKEAIKKEDQNEKCQKKGNEKQESNKNADGKETTIKNNIEKEANIKKDNTKQESMKTDDLHKKTIGNEGNIKRDNERQEKDISEGNDIKESIKREDIIEEKEEIIKPDAVNEEKYKYDVHVEIIQEPSDDEMQSESTNKKRESGEPMEPEGEAKRPNLQPPGCPDTCIYKCTQHFTTEERQAIRLQFSSLKRQAKWEFYLEHTIRKNTKKKSKNEDCRRRRHRFEYYFNKNNNKIRVCKKFFCDVIRIGSVTVPNLYKMCDSGRVTFNELNTKKLQILENPSLRLSCKKITQVESHIRSIVTSKGDNSSGNLDVDQMYAIYADSTIQPVGREIYRRVYEILLQTAIEKFEKDNSRTRRRKPQPEVNKTEIRENKESVGPDCVNSDSVIDSGSIKVEINDSEVSVKQEVEYLDETVLGF